MQHLLTLENMTLEWWEGLYERFVQIISQPEKWSHVLDGKVMATLFYEPSSRTQFSFQAAMMRLGGTTFGFSDPMTSSIAKGETLADTIRVVSCFADVVVIRSPVIGAAAEAAKWSHVPVINAGDGTNVHPTQTLADLATIMMRRGEIRNLHVGICGDLKNGRTVHSLIHALSKFTGIRMTLVSPKELGLPEKEVRYLESSSVGYDITEDIDQILPFVDIVYMTRIQKERFADPSEYERYRGVYSLNRSKLASVKQDALVMHPLPRVDELSDDIDDDPRAAYFEQVKYGLYMRMALLTDLIDVK